MKKLTNHKKKKAVFAVAPGFRISKEDAALIGNATTELIAANDGKGVTRQQLVDQARPVHSETHRLYEWDDKLAGEQHRLSQAGYYLRAVVIRDPDIPQAEQPRILAFQSVEEATEDKQFLGGKVYVTAQAVATNNEYLRQRRQTALAELKYWQQQYQDLAELQPFMRAFRVALRMYEKARPGE